MINRRHFLGRTAALTAVSLLPASLRAAGPKRDLKKAMMYGTIGFPGSVLDKFKALKAAGFDGVEAESHMNVAEVLKARDEVGLPICSVCCSTHWAKPLSSPKPDVREAGRKGIEQALREAAGYGATSVLVVPGVARDGANYQECWDRSTAELRKLVPLAGELKVRIAIENVWNDFITDPKEAVRYVDQFASPWVGWHFDTGNILYYGDPATWVRTLGKRISRVHIKEYSLELAKQDKWKGFDVKLLEGSNQWSEILRAFDDIGYRGWFISEMPGDQTKDLASLKDFAARMDKIIAS